MNRQNAKSGKEPPREIDALAHRVIGAAVEVHRYLGPGYLESLYEEGLAAELQLRGIPFQRQFRFAVYYKGRSIERGCVDLLVGGELVVELKTVESFVPIHQAQVISYLRALRKPLGLLINFHRPVLSEGIRRVVLT